jgi:hypothetical protein
MPSPRKPIARPLARTGSAESALEEVLRVLWRLLEDAHDV